MAEKEAGGKSGLAQPRKRPRTQESSRPPKLLQIYYVPFQVEVDPDTKEWLHVRYPGDPVLLDEKYEGQMKEEEVTEYHPPPLEDHDGTHPAQ